MGFYDNPTAQAAYADDAWECESCRAKPSMPVLCATCLHNRELVNRLKEQIPSQRSWRAAAVRLVARLLGVEAEVRLED